MIIFSPGPANISERVRQALMLPDISHRGEEFTLILDECRKNLLKICGAEKHYKSVIFTGSGTAAIEATLSSIRGITDKLLVLSNGHYGERAAEIGRLVGMEVDEVKLPWTQLPDLNIINDKLRKYPGKFVYVVHHETTTGLLNPLEDIASSCRKFGKTLLVDCVSSIAGEKLDLKGWEIDLIIGSANKCIRGIPGISFVIASSSLLKLLSSGKNYAYYLDLIKHYEREEKGETPFTPAVQVFYGFREALRELLEEGVHNRINKYADITEYLRRGLKENGYRLLLPEEISSKTMTSVILPENMAYEKLYRICKEKGFVIYNAIGDLKGKIFRLGTVGLIKKKEIAEFLNILIDIKERRE